MIPNASVPEELVQIQAYLRWERKGKQMYTPEQEKASYYLSLIPLINKQCMNTVSNIFNAFLLFCLFSFFIFGQGFSFSPCSFPLSPLLTAYKQVSLVLVCVFCLNFYFCLDKNKIYHNNQKNKQTKTYA